MNKTIIEKIVRNKYFIISVLTIAAFLIRLLNIDKPLGLWYDEMLTYIFASKSFPGGIIKALIREDYHMPLYYLLIHIWIKTFGSNDTILRLSSVIWGVLTIPALFFLGKTYKSEKLGYLLASIGCLSPVLIYFSQEFRFYSLLTFLATCSTILFLKLLDKQDKNKLIIFSAINLFILYIYTIGIVFVAAEFIILIFNAYQNNKTNLKQLVKSILLFLILAIPYFILLGLFITGSNNVFTDPFGWGTKDDLFPLFIINDWFSPFLTTFYGHEPYIYNTFFDSPQRVLFLIFLSSSSICFSIGFISALKGFSNKLQYLLLIALSFLSVEFYLALKGYYILIVKYTLILLPIIFLICADGLLLIKNKLIKSFCISLIFIVFLYNVINYKEMRAFETRYSGLKPAAEALMQLKPDGDYLIELERTELFKKYTKGYNLIDFDSHRILYLDKEKKEALKIFDNDFISKTNKHNAIEQLIPYLTTEEPTIRFKSYINSQINKIPQGKRLIFVEGPFYGGQSNQMLINNYANIYNMGRVPRTEFQDSLFFLINEKICTDIKNILKNSPSLIKIDEINLRQSYYAAKNVHYNIYVYKKL